MKFYHGTSEKKWKKIQKEGILWGYNIHKKTDGTKYRGYRYTYLTPFINVASEYGDVILEVEYNPIGIDGRGIDNYCFKHEIPKEEYLNSARCWQFSVFVPIEISKVKRVKYNPIYKIIADKYKIDLYFVKKGDEFCEADGEDSYINRSASAGKEIWIGIYDCEEFKLASFFHEVGHIIDPIDWSINADSETMYKSEVWAWEIGFKLAEVYGITFSDRVKLWAKKQTETYINYE